MITIGDESTSWNCIDANAHALARDAALCQEPVIVPIVEPEVLMDGPVAKHNIDRCYDVTVWTLADGVPSSSTSPELKLKCR